MRYDPTTCGQAHPYPIECSDEQVGSEQKTADENDETVSALPFAVTASIECGSVGYSETEFEDKVRRRLENGEQGAAELALWTGNDSVSGVDLGINALADTSTDVAPGDDSELAFVVGALEEWLYSTQGYGNTGFIHAPAWLAALAGRDDLIVEGRDGNVKRTPYGSIWVFGGGYPGTGAADEAPPVGGSYLYISGQVTVWRAPEMFIYPPDQTMDRETNQRFLLAEREYAVGFDCHAARALFDPLGGS